MTAFEFVMLALGVWIGAIVMSALNIHWQRQAMRRAAALIREALRERP